MPTNSDRPDESIRQIERDLAEQGTVHGGLTDAVAAVLMYVERLEDQLSEASLLDEFLPFDDHGEPTHLITLAMPSPMSFFPGLLKAIGAMAPNAVLKDSRRGTEVWSREPTEEQRKRALAGFVLLP